MKQELTLKILVLPSRVYCIRLNYKTLDEDAVYKIVNQQLLKILMTFKKLHPALGDLTKRKYDF